MGGLSLEGVRGSEACVEAEAVGSCCILAVGSSGVSWAVGSLKAEVEGLGAVLQGEGRRGMEAWEGRSWEA